MKIEMLYVDARISAHSLVRRFSRKLNLEPHILSQSAELFQALNNENDPWRKGKQVLWLTRNKGAFLKSCPGTREYLCCGYRILHIGCYCTMDCAYCILQGYFHPPVLTYFINQEDMSDELEDAFARKEILRIGTGEFTDSLIWDMWSDLTPRLVERFGRQNHAILELKTKTVAIDRLKGLKHNGKTIVAWSLNTPRMIESQEHGTASLKARMRAAAQCQQWGYRLAFHFDPLVIYPGCEEAYRQVLRTLFDHVSAEGIAWISMGTMRFMPELQSIIRRRFPQSDITYGEFIPGLDGKMRYFKPLRIRLYRSMVQWLRVHAPQVTVYLCMEDETVWRKSFGFIPRSKGGLPAMLDEAACFTCDLQGD